MENPLNLLGKLKSLFPTQTQDSDLQEEFVNVKTKLSSLIQKSGWHTENISVTRSCFCKTYNFASKKHSNEFMIHAVTEKNSNHIHIDLECQAASSSLVVNVYSDDEHHDLKCLETCVHLDDEYHMIISSLNSSNL